MTDRPDLEDLDAEPESTHWCCNGNAEDCALCTDPNPPYPFLCPGHPRTAANERIVGEATEATDPGRRSSEKDRVAVADALAAEWHRRNQRLEELTSSKGPEAQVAIVEHVRGELIGLRGALGILLGGRVQDGTADYLGWCYYREWRARLESGTQDGRVAPAACEVRIRVQAPSEENAGQWAETIRDLVLGEYGDSMRLEVTILPGGEA